MGIGRMIKKIGERGQLGLNHQSSTKKDPHYAGFFLPAKIGFRQKGISV